MPLKKHTDEDPVLNVTSMIDVILVLTIFFMVATKFSATTSGSSTSRCRSHQ